MMTTGTFEDTSGVMGEPLGENCASEILEYMYFMFPGKYAYDLRAHKERQAALLSSYLFNGDVPASYHYAVDEAGNVFDMCATPDVCSSGTEQISLHTSQTGDN